MGHVEGSRTFEVVHVDRGGSGDDTGGRRGLRGHSRTAPLIPVRPRRGLC